MCEIGASGWFYYKDIRADLPKWTWQDVRQMYTIFELAMRRPVTDADSSYWSKEQTRKFRICSVCYDVVSNWRGPFPVRNTIWIWASFTAVMEQRVVEVLRWCNDAVSSVKFLQNTIRFTINFRRVHFRLGYTIWIVFLLNM